MGLIDVTVKSKRLLLSREDEKGKPGFTKEVL
jgi:hypothetical protein